MTVKYKGIEIELGGQIYVFAPLSLASVEELEEDIIKLDMNADIKTLVDVGLKMSFHSLKRNYPAITMEFLKDNIDLGNIKSIIKSVMGASGFEQSSGDEQPKK